MAHPQSFAGVSNIEHRGWDRDRRMAHHRTVFGYYR
jgi:hypothetical protein